MTDDDALKEIQQGVSLLSDAKSGRMKEIVVRSVGEMLTTYTATYEIAAPDHFHIVIAHSQALSREEFREGSEFYHRFENEPWQKDLPTTFRGFDFYMTDGKGAEGFVQRVSDLVILGTETLDGELTHVYQYQYNVGSQSLITHTLWLSLDGYVPRKLEIYSRPNFTLPGGTTLERKVTYYFYNLNEEIKIQSPVK